MSWFCIYETDTDHYDYNCSLGYDSCEDCPYQCTQEDYEDYKADFSRKDQ